MKIGLSIDLYSLISQYLEDDSASPLRQDYQLSICENIRMVLSEPCDLVLARIEEFREAKAEDPSVCLRRSLVIFTDTDNDNDEDDGAIQAIAEGAQDLISYSDLSWPFLSKVFRKAEQRRIFRAAIIQNEGLFFSTCHEFRGPLSAISSITEKLKRACRGDYLERLVELLSLSCDSLLFLVDENLDFAQVSSGTLTVRRSCFSPAHLIEQAVCMVARQAKEKGISLSIAVAPEVNDSMLSDPYRIRQILINFLTNAIKFTNSGAVTARVDTIENDGECFIRFSIQDTGVGIEIELQERIFEPFFQARGSGDSLIGGNGLGLSICKKLADLLGGSIGCKSVRNEGTLFWLDIPLNDDEETTETIPASSEDFRGDLDALLRTGEVPVFELRDTGHGSRHANGIVLLVEDNPVNSELTAMDLRDCGVQVETAASGVEALELCIARRFDLILMDCQLPNFDGCETTRLIRSHERETGRSPAPIVAVTGSALSEERTRCFLAGMNDYMSKPVSCYDLGNLVTRYCGSNDFGKTTPENRFMELGRQLDSQAVQRTLKVFADDTRKLLLDLAGAIEREDLGLCQTAAHKLRGTCLYMGFSELGQQFEFIESIEEMALVHSAFDFASTSLGEYLKEVDSWLVRVD